ncbi:MAG: hypothetical protein OXG35_19510, partial [Acidobacteria bacterium]|nr:hypothetical protein [Acidobacteriota bacterium]
MSRKDRDRDLRYQPDERPPGGFVLGCGAQLVVLGITGLVAFPTIVVRAAGETEAYLSWAVFCTVAVSGVATVLQALRIGRVGAGYILTTGPAAPLGCTAVMTSPGAAAVSGAAGPGTPSGTSVRRPKTTGSTVAGISMFTVPTMVGVRNRRNSDRRADIASGSRDET